MNSFLLSSNEKVDYLKKTVHNILQMLYKYKNKLKNNLFYMYIYTPNNI